MRAATSDAQAWRESGEFLDFEGHRLFAHRGGQGPALGRLCLIDGVDDPISGASIVRRWRELLPAATVSELPGVGHYPQIEAADRVLAAFLSFQP